MDLAIVRRWIDSLPDDYDHLVIGGELVVSERSLESNPYLTEEEKEEAKEAARKQLEKNLI